MEQIKVIGHELTIFPKKPLSLLKKEHKIDSRKAVGALINAIVDAIDLKPGSALKSLFKSMVDSTSKQSVEELAWVLLFEGFTHGLLKIIRSHSEGDGIPVKLLTEKVVANKVIAFLAKEENISPLCKSFFDKPDQYVSVVNIQPYFLNLLESLRVDSEKAQNIVKELPSAFTHAIHSFVKGDEIALKPLLDYFDGGAAARLEILNGRKAYKNRLIAKAKTNLYDEKYSIKDIYIAQNGIKERNGQSNSDNKTLCLHKELFDWGLDKKQWGVCFVGGASGSGKSSLSIMLAAEWSENIDFPIVSVSFEHSCFDSINFYDSIEKFSKNCDLTLNPLDPKNKEQQVLLVLDGLDDFRETHGFPDKLLRSLKELMLEHKEQQLFRRVLITGRESLIREIQSVFHYEAASYYFIQPMSCSETGSDDCLKARLWEKYIKAAKITDQYNYDALKGTAVYKFADSPLLHFLIARYSHIDEGSYSKIENTARLYRHIVDKMYKNSVARLNTVEQCKPFKRLDENKFIELVEWIAIQMWQRASQLHQNIDTSESSNEQLFSLDTAIKSVNTEMPAFDISESSNVLLFRRAEVIKYVNAEMPDLDSEWVVARLLEVFLFKVDLKHNDKFGLIHKSFRDYFVAKGMVKLLKLSANDDFCDNEEQIETLHLEKWIVLFGPSALDDETLEMFSQELELESPEDCKQWQLIIEKLINRVLAEDLPMEQLGLKTFKQMTTQARYTGLALLLVLCQLAEKNKCKAKITGPVGTAFGEWFKFLQGQRAFKANGLLFKNLRNLDLSRSILYMQDFCKTDLNNFSFELADLSASNFSHANLSGANFDNALLNETSFWCASLAGATLVHTSFKSANLGRVKAQKAILQEVDFSNSNLVKADFTYADLTGSVFEDANLMHATLLGATVLETSFEKAQLNHAKMEHLQFKHASFEEADLTDTHAAASFFYDVNMKNTNLTRSLLTGCQWKNVNLSNANFSDAKLCRTVFADVNLAGARFDNACLDGAWFDNKTDLESLLTKTQLDSLAKTPPF